MAKNDMVNLTIVIKHSKNTQILSIHNVSENEVRVGMARAKNKGTGIRFVDGEAMRNVDVAPGFTSYAIKIKKRL